MNETTDWWAWDGDNFYYLGAHADIEDAYEIDDKRPGISSTWVFSRESLVAMREKIDEELK